MFKVSELLTVEEASYLYGMFRGAKFPADLRNVLMTARANRVKPSKLSPTIKVPKYPGNYARPEPEEKEK